MNGLVEIGLLVLDACVWIYLLVTIFRAAGHT
jgi:hypothetical protein